MKPVVDVYFSFRSPYSYLATPDLIKLRASFEIEVKLRPVLPIAIRAKHLVFDDQQGKQKAGYIILDSFRRAEYLHMNIAWPTPDPVVQNLETFEVAKEQPYIYRLCALAIEADRRGKGIDFAYEVSHLIFSGTESWHEGDLLTKAIGRAGLDINELESAIHQQGGEQAYLAEIQENQNNLEKNGHWGVPTMVFNAEPFFGQDRIDDLCWRLDQQNVAAR